MMHQKSFRSQKGTFTVEFAIVGLMFAFMIAFCSDVVLKMSMKGKLDRMSFSAVNLLKERTALFGSNNYLVSEQDFNRVDAVIQASLKRTLASFNENNFGFTLEVWTESGGQPAKTTGGQTCETGDDLTQADSVLTSWGRYASLYRVTLCYETQNWYGSLIGEEYGIVHSSALMIGR